MVPVPEYGNIMYRSVVPGTIADVVPVTLISVGGVAISFDAGVPNCPSGHTRDTHEADEFAPAAEDVPALQFVQTLAPVTDEYVPAGQFAHAADEFAPAAEIVPAGHARQSDVLFTQPFSCADAWAKTSFDRCVFQT